MLPRNDPDRIRVDNGGSARQMKRPAFLGGP